MKNKKLLYVLLVISVVVWGGVFVKIYQVVVKPEQLVIDSSRQVAKFSYHPQKDTLQLLANYKDPFFKRAFNSDPMIRPVRKTDKQRTVHKKVKEPVLPVVVDWSFIVFKGTIKRKSTGKSVSLLRIHSKEYFLEEGTEVQGVQLCKDFKDSVLVKYNGVQTYIKRL